MVAGSAAQVGSVAERDLLDLGVALYWAEGAKRKPWAARDRITFVNSDPSIVRTWLRWLDLVGVSRERCRFRLQIHDHSTQHRSGVSRVSDHRRAAVRRAVLPSGGMVGGPVLDAMPCRVYYPHNASFPGGLTA
jgi:hypothetical protein